MCTTITKEYIWDMSHMLAGHGGLCKNIHGHTYKMEVTVARKDGDVIDVRCDGACSPAHGMVIDFKDLSNIVKELVVKPLDHAFMGWKDTCSAEEQEIIDVLKRHGLKTYLVDYRPTAENMAKDFFIKIQNQLDALEHNGNLEVVSVKIWETPTSYAVYSLQGGVK